MSAVPCHPLPSPVIQIIVAVCRPQNRAQYTQRISPGQEKNQFNLLGRQSRSNAFSDKSWGCDRGRDSWMPGHCTGIQLRKK